MTRPRVFLGWLILVLILSACQTATPSPTPVPTSTAAVEAGPVQGPTATLVPPAATATPGASTAPTTPPFAPAVQAPLSKDANSYFAASGKCVRCHVGLRDQSGAEVNQATLWRASPMANAAVDPYYQAAVSNEIQNHPEYRAAIEQKCSTCHMPMAHFADVGQGKGAQIFGPDGYLSPSHPWNRLALEGVSCTVCHQIQPEGLGQRFSGDLPLDFTTPPGQRVVFGSFAPTRAGQMRMPNESGFVPRQSDHLGTSEVCAVCHNLYTHYVTADGALSEDVFPEQTPYTEWRYSAFAPNTSCQDCHMPEAQGSVVLTAIGQPVARQPVRRHEFTGGNTYLLRLLKAFGGGLQAMDGEAGFAAAIARTQAFLQSQTAILTIAGPQAKDGNLTFRVTVTNLTGHKFPSAYPSRRAWLHVTVRDAAGQVAFESGAYTPEGAIHGNDNDADP